MDTSLLATFQIPNNHIVYGILNHNLRTNQREIWRGRADLWSVFTQTA